MFGQMIKIGGIMNSLKSLLKIVSFVAFSVCSLTAKNDGTLTQNAYLQKAELLIIQEGLGRNQITIQPKSGLSITGKYKRFSTDAVFYSIKGRNQMLSFPLDKIDKIYVLGGIVKSTVVFEGKVYFNLQPEPETETNQITEQISQSQEYDSEYYNPCEDELYSRLKQKDLNEMTEREYTYFMQKDKDCSEWLKQTQGRKNKSVTKVTTQPSTKEDQITDYYLNGVTMAERNFQSNASIGGLASGCLGGLLGWGIGYAILSGMEVDVPYSLYQNLSIDDQYKFKEGYKSVAQQIRKKEFNTGAAIGTGMIVIFALISLN